MGCPVDGVWGFPDGTARTTCRPVRGQRKVYSGYYKKHVHKFQSVVTPDGLLRHFYGPIESHRTDSCMMEQSRLYEAMDGELAHIFHNKKRLWADGGYGLNKFTMRPFINPVPGSPEHMFNTKMASLRISVEWGFNWVIQNFKYVEYAKQQKTTLLQPTALYYTFAVLLANCKAWMRGGNQISDYFNMDPP